MLLIFVEGLAVRRRTFPLQHLSIKSQLMICYLIDLCQIVTQKTTFQHQGPC